MQPSVQTISNHHLNKHPILNDLSGECNHSLPTYNHALDYTSQSPPNLDSPIA